jgi:hypothetical protein
VAAALQGHYNSSAEKYHAVLQALERSGTPQQEKWESSGLRMGNEMMRRGISDKWKCYDAGCYFVVSADRAQSPDLALDIVKTRDAVAHGYIVAITADDAPYKMAILLNYYPDLESQQSGGSK